MPGNMSLLDFFLESVDERDAQADEEDKIKDLLSRFTAQMLRDRLRGDGGHPRPEWGDEGVEGECDGSWRFYYLDECRRRGVRLLEQLGWPASEDSVYVNRYTGCVETLLDVVTDNGYFADRHTIANQAWAVVENWEPYDSTKQNHYKVAYLRNELESLQKIKLKPKKDAYERCAIKKIPGLEKELAEELKKNS